MIKAGLGRYHPLELQPADIVAHCRKCLVEDNVSPAAQAQDVGYLGEVLEYPGPAGKTPGTSTMPVPALTHGWSCAYRTTSSLP